MYTHIRILRVCSAHFWFIVMYYPTIYCLSNSIALIIHIFLWGMLAMAEPTMVVHHYLPTGSKDYASHGKDGGGFYSSIWSKSICMLVYVSISWMEIVLSGNHHLGTWELESPIVFVAIRIYCKYEWIGLREKLQESLIYLMEENHWFPVICPLNQSVEQRYYIWYVRVAQECSESWFFGTHRGNSPSPFCGKPSGAAFLDQFFDVD